jgi:hypothetical protein
MKWHLFKIQGPILTDFLILEQVTIFFSVEKKHVKNNIQNAARYHKLYDVYLSTQKKKCVYKLECKSSFCAHIHLYTYRFIYVYGKHGYFSICKFESMFKTKNFNFLQLFLNLILSMLSQEKAK